MSADTRPVLRLLHMMARSGGTIIAKCLGVMPGVVMLSEVHPSVPDLMHTPPTKKNKNALAVLWSFDPLRQADQWYGLLTDEDKDQVRASRRTMPFDESIAMIERRARQRGLSLIVRDWSHLDFLGEPFNPDPPGRFAVVESLGPRFRLARTITVRHPIDQWLSMRNLPMLREEIALEAYLAGCRRFAEEAAKLGFVRFEDFAAEPQRHVRMLCERLEIACDPSFEQRWSSFRTITGDVGGSRGQDRISLPPRRAIDAGLLDRFAASADYRATIELLGYGHP
ncbi:MAG: hypothetical protein IT436_01980 [Phycisphaerales bacterium]|nr:hypothetical protein [Phycisphaerales bacterium]